jgi:pyruvate,water dikinase
MNPTTNILFFEQCSLKDVALMGGKGANLGELSAAGFPVPRGFGVTADAYCSFLECNRLEPKIREIAAAMNFDNHEQVAADTEKIRSLLNASPIPAALVEEIGQAYARLGADSLVAIRSSSSVPDIGVSSFPGMMDTFYNIRGLDQLLEYIKLCWTSVWTARAAANRWNKGIDHFAVHVCALVQQMIPSEFSGVAFTVNPVSMAEELVIEAIPGLGEALVSGKVTPDAFVVAKETLSLAQRPSSSETPADLILQVASIARDIEKHYGRPQDIEWAFAGGRIYILQSRNVKHADELRPDVAGLERWNKPAETDEGEIIWTRAWSDEVLTRAITPLFYSVQADLITETYDFMYRASGMNQFLPLKLMRFHKNRGYFSTRYLMECLRYAPKFVRGDDALKFFTPVQKEEARSMPFLLWAKIKSELYLSRHYKKYTLTRCYKTFYDDWLPELLARVRKLDTLNLDRATPAELSEYYWAMDRLIKDHCQPIGFGVMVHTFAAVTFLGTVLQKWLGDSSSASVLLSGLPSNYTVEFNEKVWHLARKIAASDELRDIFTNVLSSEIPTRLNETTSGREFAAELEAFRQTYAFRGAEDREISFPRWGDDPALLIDVLKLFVGVPDDAAPEAALKKNEARREALTREIEQKLARTSWGFFKKRIFRFLLKYAQIYSLFRENQRFEVDRVFYGQRKAFVAIGRNLVERNCLADPDDIWFLSKEEVFDVMNGKIPAAAAARLITPRRAEYRKYLRTTPPMFLQGDREFDLETDAVPQTATGNVLTGVAASSGQATGTARVVRDIKELSRVKPGDILVTNSTDPGWTPVFLIIRGLVLETGGILAHGTVLSREYGIPAVTSLKNATRLIREGDRITIDGTHGTIHLSDP